MPKRTDISSILVIGAGPIIIGSGVRVRLFGHAGVSGAEGGGLSRHPRQFPTPATIMTDPEFADATYIEPITPYIVARIIEKERPDALLPTMGGQTALNCALKLAEQGVLEKFGVEMIGAKADAIDKAENRQRFRQANGPHRAGKRAQRCGAHCGRSLSGVGTHRPAVHHPPQASPWAGPAAASHTTAANSKRSCAAVSMPAPPTRS